MNSQYNSAVLKRLQSLIEEIRKLKETLDRLDLKEQEYIESEVKRIENLYYGISELYKFVLGRRETLKPELKAKDVEHALKIIRDLQELGSCTLQNLNLVLVQNKGVSLTTIDIGRTIYQILKQAHEKMGGTGVRSDAGYDWRYYNILYYRYFRYNLKTKEIAARLHYESTRSYYRDRKKAIKALLTEIMEMEASSFQSDK